MQGNEHSEGSRQAEFIQLAIPLMGLLYGVALSLTGNRVDAEDLVQDTYLKAYRFFHRFEAGTNFRAWICRILINLFRSRLRYRSRRPDLVFSSQLDSSVADPAAGEQEPAHACALGLFEDEVQRALDHLSPPMRLVVELVDIQGLTYREAAECLGCPVGTVMSRLYRARGRLQRRLFRLARSRGYGNDNGRRSLC